MEGIFTREREIYCKKVQYVFRTVENDSYESTKKSSSLIPGEEDGIKVLWTPWTLLILRMSCQEEGGTGEYAFIQFMVCRFSLDEGDSSVRGIWLQCDNANQENYTTKGYGSPGPGKCLRVEEQD